MAKRRSAQKESKEDATAENKEQPDAELRIAVHKIISPVSETTSRVKIKRELVTGGEIALRLLIAATESKFESGITDLEGSVQKWTLLTCRDICLSHKVNRKLLERLEYTVHRMGSSYEKAELLNLLGGQLAKKKALGANPNLAPKRRAGAGQRTEKTKMHA